MTGKLRRWLRIARGVVALLVVESLVFGLAALPAIGFWTWVAQQPLLGSGVLRTLVLAISVAPAYLIFSCSLMALTAVCCRLLGWQAPQGDHSIRALDPDVVRWAKHNAAAHVVRVICGELFRATPIWRWYLRGMGAKLGKGVHVNTAAVYDINLFTMGDHVVIGGKAQLSAHLVEEGILKLRSVTIEDGATVGTGSIVSPGVHVGKRGQVGALSFVTKGTRIPPDTAFGGVPARFIKRFEEVDVPEDGLVYRGPVGTEASTDDREAPGQGQEDEE